MGLLNRLIRQLRFDAESSPHDATVGQMKLVVGLGNPGPRYQGTRHNVGFDVVSLIAKCHQLGKPKKKFKGLLHQTKLKSQHTLLLCPLTFMNLSGQSVQLASRFYRISTAETLVVCDDLNLPVGRLRIRPGGSSGGQKGLADIMERLGTQEIPRLRIGIGDPPNGQDATDFVLSRFGKAESDSIQKAMERAREAVLDWLSEGVEFCMNKYNGA